MRYTLVIGVGLMVLAAVGAGAQVRVTGVSDAKPRLAAGGPAVPVTVAGANLSAVSGARVTQSGRVATGVQATLKGVSGGRLGSSLVVVLSATASAQAGGYQLQLLAGRQSIAVPLVVTVTAPAPSVPIISSANPAQVVLQAAGAAQTITLNGKTLDQVSGAYVERNGTRLQGRFDVQLKGSTDPTRRTVVLRAYASAGPPWGSPANLVLESMSGGTLVAIQTPVVITVPPPPVDLVVSACAFDTAGVTASLPVRATIRNNGTQGATFQGNELVARVKGLGPSQDVKAAGGGLYIAAGGTADVVAYVPTASIPTGQQAATWTVDPADHVVESSSTNNGKWCPFTWNAPSPQPVEQTDLAVPIIISQPNHGPPGTKFTFTVRVKNNGPGEARHPATFAKCFLDGAIFGGDVEPYPSSALQAGEARDYIWTIATQMAPGTKRLECKADYGNEVEETNENNNSRTIMFVVDEP